MHSAHIMTLNIMNKYSTAHVFRIIAKLIYIIVFEEIKHINQTTSAYDTTHSTCIAIISKGNNGMNDQNKDKKLDYFPYMLTVDRHKFNKRYRFTKYG